MNTCTCACHINNGTHRPTCTIDRGSSGIPGIPSCSPCSYTRQCQRCDLIDAHQWVEGDCILPHLYDRTTHPPIATHGNACPTCIDRHREWLEEIRDLHETLDQVIDIGSIVDDTAEHTHQKKRPASPAPIRLDAWVMLNDTDRLFAGADRYDGIHRDGDYLNGIPDVQAVLAEWADLAVETGAHDLRVSHSVTGSTAQLAAAAEHMGSQPTLDDYDAELRWIRRALRRAHGITDPEPIGHCLTVNLGRDCGGYVWPVTGARPKCDRCGRTYQVRDLARLHAQERRTSA